MVIMLDMVAENELGQYPHFFHNETSYLVPSPSYGMDSRVKCNLGKAILLLKILALWICSWTSEGVLEWMSST